MFGDQFTLIEERHADLTDELKLGGLQLDAERRFVHGLGQSGTETPVHFDRATDDALGQFVQIEIYHIGRSAPPCL